MLHNQLSLRLMVAAVSLVLVNAFHRCDAFGVRPSQPISGIINLHTTYGFVQFPSITINENTRSNGDNTGIWALKRPSLLELSMAKLPPNKNDANDEPRKYTAVEDGSPLGVAVVGLGFLALQLFGDRLDGSTVEQYAAPIIFCSASLAAGISRLVRNSAGWKNRNK